MGTAIFEKGNGERGMRFTIYHEILHSEQFEVAEFIDDNRFLHTCQPDISQAIVLDEEQQMLQV